MTTYAVTGATGGLGSAAVHSLRKRGVDAGDITAIVRDRAKATELEAAGVRVRVADYADPAALRTALAGVDRLLLISGSEVGSRVPQHTNVIEAAKAAGVDVLAYTSILSADTSPLALAAEHVETERVLAASGVPHILLRNGWYWDNYVSSAETAIASGSLYGSAGTGKVAGAARTDYADAAAAALIDGREAVYELAGSDHLTYTEIAATIAEVSGKPVLYVDIPEADYVAALEKAGVPAPMAGILANSDTGVSTGALDSESTDLADLRGTASTPLATVLGAALGPAS